MSRAVSKPIALDNSRARRIWLRAQRLDESAPFGAGPGAVPAAVKHLGYVQIDTINVIERCHHHILFTRIPEYRREHLHRAQSEDKTVFEYLAHALAYMPVEDFRYSMPEMRARWKRRDESSVTPKELRKVLSRIRRNGALTLRDIDDDELREKDHAWASKKPSERALRLAFYGGQVTISRRTGILKTYDLTKRHFGWDALPRPATERETLNYLLDRALRSQGLVSLDSVCHLDAPSKPGMRKLIAQRLRNGELVPVAIDGAGKQEHWAAPGAIETVPDADTGLVHILSPFDPLIIQRKRTKRFFGYDHVFEAYVPKPRRKFGYFALPVLIGEDIVAAVDLKTDRAQEKLLIQRWTWIGKGSRRTQKMQIEDALDRFERFQLAR